MKNWRFTLISLATLAMASLGGAALGDDENVVVGSATVARPTFGARLDRNFHQADPPRFMVPPNPKPPRHLVDEFPHPPAGANDGVFEPAIGPYTMTNSWDSVGPNGLNPPDPTIAASNTEVLVATNDDFAIYDRATGAQLSYSDVNAYLGDSAFYFDPKVFYDRYSSRFFMVYLERTQGTTHANSVSRAVVMVSNNNNATGGFYWYRIDMRGGSEWFDYPYIGTSTSSVMIGGTNIGWFGSGAYYARLTVMPKTEMINAQGFTYYFFTGMSSNGTSDDSVTPTQPQQGESTGYIVNAKDFGSNTVTVRRMTYAWPAAPTLGAPEVITVTAYTNAPNGRQPGGATSLDVIWPRLLHATSGWGYIHATQQTGATYGATTIASARLYRFGTGTNPATVQWQTNFDDASSDYIYPAIAQNFADDTALAVFGRTSTSENPSIRFTGRLVGDGAWAGSAYAKAGTDTHVNSATRNRWGDYFAACMDPWDLRSFWLYGQYGKATNSWGTWVNRVNYKPTPTITVDAIANAQTTSSVNLTATLLDGATPLSGRTVEFLISGSSVGTATTNASGVATLSYLIPLQVPTTRTIRANFAEESVYNETTGTNTLQIVKANTACFGSNVTWPFSATNAYLWGYLWRTTDNASLVGEVMTFKVGATTVATAPMASSWVQAPIPIPYTPGTYNYTVEYPGNSFYNSSVSTADTLTVTKASTAISVANVGGTAGSTVNLSATLTRTTDNNGLNGQFIQFSVNGVNVGAPQSTNASGIANLSYTIPAGSLGSVSIGAAYAGNTFYNASSGTGTLTRQGRVISGTMALQSYIPSRAGIVADFELVDGIGNVVATWSSTLNATGGWTYSSLNVPTGNYVLRGKAWHWLSAVRNTTVALPGATSQNTSHRNGDVNGDNEVGPADFTQLSASFGKMLGDPGFNINADLNGDDEVGPADFTILSSNFGQIGD